MQLKMFDLISENIKEDDTLTELDIVSWKDFDNLRITHTQIKLIINALKVFEICVDDSNLHEVEKNKKVRESKELADFLENIIDYNYDKAVNKCINKNKQLDDEIGQDAMNLAWKESQKKME